MERRGWIQKVTSEVRIVIYKKAKEGRKEEKVDARRWAEKESNEDGGMDI